MKKKLKILLVDDTPENLVSIEAALSQLGEELVLARSGTEALRCLLHNDFAAILLDVKMPVMDGFETAELIRTSHRSRHTPILFLTAYKGDEHLFRGYHLGAVDFLFKPVLAEVLRSKVAAFVELARQADELRERARIMEQQSEVLRKTEQRFRSLLEAAPDSMVICKADGTIEFINSKTESWFSYSRDDLAGRNVRDLIPDWTYELLPGPDEDSGEIAVRGTPDHCGLGARHRDGLIFPVEISLSPLQTDDGLLIITAIRDISERVRMEDERRRAEEQVRQLNQRLRALSASLQSAREEEGTRIAREIHDELGAALTSLKWDLEVLDKTLSETDTPSQVSASREKITAMVNVTDTTINTVRRIASELRPSILDDLGLSEAVEWQAQRFQARTGITCNCEYLSEGVNLTPDQSTALFRILQEALTNILRHAEATRVDIVMESVAGEFVLLIRDDGRGITENQKSTHLSLGILGMQERAHLVGGRVDVSGTAATGTLVAVRVPLSGVEPSESIFQLHA